MDFHAFRQARKFLFELVSSRNLEGHQGDLPGPGGGSQGLFESPDVEDEDAARKMRWQAGIMQNKTVLRRSAC